jgi:hypothetical protein
MKHIRVVWCFLTSMVGCNSLPTILNQGVGGDISLSARVERVGQPSRCDIIFSVTNHTDNAVQVPLHDLSVGGVQLAVVDTFTAEALAEAQREISDPTLIRPPIMPGETVERHISLSHRFPDIDHGFSPVIVFWSAELRAKDSADADAERFGGYIEVERGCPRAIQKQSTDPRHRSGFR